MNILAPHKPHTFAEVRTEEKVKLTPFERALIYWSRLGAPVDRIATALQVDVSSVSAGYKALAHKNSEEVSSKFSRLAGYPSQTPWPSRTVNRLILDGLKRPLDSSLVMDSERGALRVRDVVKHLSSTAVGLQVLGITKGSRVAVDGTQRFEGFLIAIASLLLGAEVVPLSLGTGLPGLQEMLNIAPSQLTFSAFADDLLGQKAAGRLISLKDTASRVQTYKDWFSKCPEHFILPNVEVSPTDIALVGFTSGSTGQPKLLLSSQESLFRSAEVMQSMFKFTSDDIFCASTEFTATFRSMVSMPLLSGGKVAFASQEALQHPLALARDCKALGVTQLTAVPNVLRGMVKGHNKIAADALTSVRHVFSGAGVLDQITGNNFELLFHVPVVDFYGTRETFAIAYCDPKRRGTMSTSGGRICNALVGIVDDDGNEVAPGRLGAIVVHSDCVMANLALHDVQEWRGWHCTGDMGCVNSDGSLSVVGRKKEAIKTVDGSLIFPVQVETLLNSIPQVRESCVLGFADSSGREHIIAAVRLVEPSENIELFIRKHVLAVAGRFMVPTRVFVMENFPRVASQKVDKASLRRKLAPELQQLLVPKADGA